MLLLQVLLGLRPDIRNQQLRSVLPLGLPSWVGSMRLSGLRAFDRTWDVRVEEGMIRVEANE